ncbi:MAG: lyase family protein [Candidatus Daviesbacteria bacterium]|nr:lyase family protein [Candidatus Daviesbacteria bacterium]
MANERPVIPNVLADRYASTPMIKLFSPEGRIISERGLWITVMKGQASRGLTIPDNVIAAYENTQNIVDLAWIRERELILRHDEKAKLEAANNLAGFEFAHMGMTSRDQSDNVEQMLNKAAMLMIRDRVVATLARFADLAATNSTLIYGGRTHNAVAQPSLIGKMFSDAGEDLLLGLNRLETTIENYPLRGIKGAMGTQTDQLQLLGSQENVDGLEQLVAESLGFKKILGSVGQVYPRSLDYDVVTTLYQLVSGPASLAVTMRLMAGNEQFTEGFKEGQVGSSAMPHKMNSRTSERIRGLKNVLGGHVNMIQSITGEQWYGGDVSDSSTRRVALPDAFFTTDGIFQAMLTICDECGFYPAVIKKEYDRILPFLTTTRLLMVAVQDGAPREEAYKIIQKHAKKVALEMREKGSTGNDLLDRLAEDPDFGVPKEKLEKALSNPMEFVGSAPKQITDFINKVEPIIKKYPEAAAYMPEEIL